MAPPPPARRSPAEPLQPKRRDSENTRARLLAAARGRFEKEGYEHTNVRDIAADAGVNQALIFRYFGTKEELFRACTAYTERLAPDQIFAGPLDDLPAHLFDQILRFWPVDGGYHPLVGMLRPSGTDEVVVERLRRRLTAELPQQYADLIAAAGAGGTAGENAADDDTVTRGLLLVAWMLGIGMLRTVLAAPGLSNEELHRVSSPFAQGVRALLPQPDAD